MCGGTPGGFREQQLKAVFTFLTFGRHHDVEQSTWGDVGFSADGSFSITFGPEPGQIKDEPKTAPKGGRQSSLLTNEIPGLDVAGLWEADMNGQLLTRTFLAVLFQESVQQQEQQRQEERNLAWDKDARQGAAAAAGAAADHDPYAQEPAAALDEDDPYA
eukprot:gene1685-31248_t